MRSMLEGLKTDIKEWWKDSTYMPPVPKAIERKLKWHVRILLAWLAASAALMSLMASADIYIGLAVFGAVFYAWLHLAWCGYGNISAKKLWHSERPGNKKWHEKSRTRKALDILPYVAVFSMIVLLCLW